MSRLSPKRERERNFRARSVFHGARHPRSNEVARGRTTNEMFQRVEQLYFATIALVIDLLVWVVLDER
jgi:hypothetical protein